MHALALLARFLMLALRFFEFTCPPAMLLHSAKTGVSSYVIAATRAGRGWQLTVKWVGYDETTIEPLWRILQDTKGHPEILQEIERCKADYYLQHPGARNADLADFQDVSLVNIESLRPPLETLPMNLIFYS